jgi:hypothetical protein
MNRRASRMIVAVALVGILVFAAAAALFGAH